MTRKVIRILDWSMPKEPVVKSGPYRKQGARTCRITSYNVCYTKLLRPRKGETTWRETVDREVLATRAGVGLCDVTTLGKVDVQGADAGEFLNRIYANAMGSLKVGMVRYGLMLREDGHAYDDGTCARLAEDHYVRNNFV